MVDLDTLIDGIDSLPMLPQSSAKLVSMLNDRDLNMAEIAEIVRTDDALSMVVMRYANSAAFGTTGRAFDLRESVVRLGSEALLKLVLEQQVGSVFTGGCQAFELDRKSIWRGSIGGAVAAENIASQHHPDVKDLCFVAGLVRDVGKLVLDRKYGADYAKSVFNEMTNGSTFTDAERLAFGTDHAEVGAALCGHWGLPVQIVDAVMYHHSPPTAENGGDPITDIVHAADIIALWSGIGIGADGMQHELASHVKLSLKISRKAAEKEIASMWSKVGAIEAALGINGSEVGRSAA